MSCKYPFRVYKNEDITLSFPVDFESEPNEFYLHVYTVGDAYVDVPYSALTIEDGVATVVLDAGTLDPLNDGVIRYEMAYSEGDDDYTTDANTNMVLKTPSNYSGKTADEMWMDGYQSGLTDCSGVDCDGVYESGVTAGISQQKAKLADTAITQNATYTRTDGWKRVVVNVPQTGHTDAEMQEEYERGFDDGLSACSGDCEGIYESGYTKGYEDGLNDCSGETPDCSEAYESGITEGIRQQKSLLTNTGITSNGTYTRENGWNEVVINVAQTGYTQQDLDDAWADGYTSGQTDCGGDCTMGSVLMYRTTNNTKINDIIHEGFTGSSVEENWSYVNSGATVISHTFYPEQNLGVVVWDSCVERIPYGAFKGFPTLSELYLPDTLKYIADEVFDCGHSNTGTTSNLQFVSIAPNQENFYYQAGYEAFYFSNVEEVVLPVGSQRIPESFFNRCEQLVKIEIPSGVTNIGRNAFNQCYSLSAITIPASVTNIGFAAFAHCTGLTRVDVLATTPPSLAQDDVFYDTNCPIYVPAASLNAYLSDSTWATYSSRIQAAS